MLLEGEQCGQDHPISFSHYLPDSRVTAFSSLQPLLWTWPSPGAYFDRVARIAAVAVSLDPGLCASGRGEGRGAGMDGQKQHMGHPEVDLRRKIGFGGTVSGTIGDVVEASEQAVMGRKYAGGRWTGKALLYTACRSSLEDVSWGVGGKWPHTLRPRRPRRPRLETSASTCSPRCAGGGGLGARREAREPREDGPPAESQGEPRSGETYVTARRVNHGAFCTSGPGFRSGVLPKFRPLCRDHFSDVPSGKGSEQLTCAAGNPRHSLLGQFH